MRYDNQVVAVLTHQTALAARRKASPLESAYLDCAGDLLHMLSEGTFPNVGDLAMSRSSPRVGDGFIRLDMAGDVVFASPNALSAYHRMGLTAELEGHNLVSVTRPLISDPFEAHELAEHVRDSLAGGSSMRMEVDAGGAAVLLRTLPLVVHGRAVGAAVLIRDVTEIKRRDRALLSKDATIREIHHRVKNNLQTVAALLRLQARRTNNAEGREALIESVRRVSSIALVHDALSMSVDEVVNLDEVVDRILPIMNDVATVDTPIRISRVGDLGVLDADRATALIMVITELVQNAIEHAFDASIQQGCVTIRAERSARWLDVVVHDDGRGLPDGFSLEKSDRLGLQIVRTLVSAELDGSLGMHDVPDRRNRRGASGADRPPRAAPAVGTAAEPRRAAAEPRRKARAVPRRETQRPSIQQCSRRLRVARLAGKRCGTIGFSSILTWRPCRCVTVTGWWRC